MTGQEYSHLVARYVVKNFEKRGIKVYREVNVGTSIIGKSRRIDVYVYHKPNNRALAIECKYQDSPGTVDEKIHYTLQDLRALRMPAALVYAGRGFSEGVLHLLQGSEIAAYCLPDKKLRRQGRRQGKPNDFGTWQLDHILSMTFDWWDVILENKKAVTL